MLHIQLARHQGDFQLTVEVNTASSGVIALFGRSGCGKSTTINLMAGLLQPDSGRLQLDDQVLFDSQQKINVPSEQRHIGCVFQNARLFPHYTVTGNLRYGLTRSAGKRYIDIDSVIELLGLRTLLNRRPHQLSGGEQQRVALGRALLSQPRLLLLDEPLASLDQARRMEVLPYLERIRDQLGIPMVYVSHQFEEVLQLATHVVLMDNGTVLAQGDLPTISREPGLRHIIGAEAMGTVIDSHVHSVNGDEGLALIAAGAGHLKVDANGLKPGQPVRMQLLARDLILSLHAPHGLSVRNSLQGIITHMENDANAVLVHIDIGGLTVMSRVTRSAAQELALRERLPLWVLVKAITLRGHVFHTGTNASLIPA